MTSKWNLLDTYIGWAGCYPHPAKVIIHLTATWFVHIGEYAVDLWDRSCQYENYEKNSSLRVFVLLLKKEHASSVPLLLCSGLHKLIPVFFRGERNFSDKKSLMFSHFSSSFLKTVPQHFIKPNLMECHVLCFTVWIWEQPGFFW